MISIIEALSELVVFLSNVLLGGYVGWVDMYLKVIERDMPNIQSSLLY